MAGILILNVLALYMNEVIFKRKAQSKGDPGILGVVISACLIIFSIFLLYNVVKSVQITQGKLQILAQAEKDVDTLRLENIRLIMQKDSIETKDYIETQARNKLNYAKPNEKVFIISDLAYKNAGLLLDTMLASKTTLTTSTDLLHSWTSFLFN
jgi:cell division protein FtsB